MKEQSIKLKVKTCQQCPFFLSERAYTADSFEMCFNWFCNKEEKKKIRSYVDWNEEDKVPIPEWCPVLMKDKAEYDSLDEEREALTSVLEHSKSRLKEIEELKKNNIKGKAVRTLNEVSVSEKVQFFDKMFENAMIDLNTVESGKELDDEEHYVWEEFISILAKDKKLFWEYWRSITK